MLPTVRIAVKPNGEIRVGDYSSSIRPECDGLMEKDYVGTRFAAGAAHAQVLLATEMEIAMAEKTNFVLAR